MPLLGGVVGAAWNRLGVVELLKRADTCRSAPMTCIRLVDTASALSPGWGRFLGSLWFVFRIWLAWEWRQLRRPTPQGKVKLMDGERIVFTEECQR